MRDLIDLVENMSNALTLYHLTDDARFSLDSEYSPEDNAISINDRNGHKGIYLAKSVETWINGHHYWRPFVVEFEVDPKVLEHDTLSRWGGEVFIPADHFDKLRIVRVIPTDAYAREEYHRHGWFEDSSRIEFDTGNPITAKDWETPFAGWRYEGDTRTMSDAEIAILKQRFDQGSRARD